MQGRVSASALSGRRAENLWAEHIAGPAVIPPEGTTLALDFLNRGGLHDGAAGPARRCRPRGRRAALPGERRAHAAGNVCPGLSQPLKLRRADGP